MHFLLVKTRFFGNLNFKTTKLLKLKISDTQHVITVNNILL